MKPIQTQTEIEEQIWTEQRQRHTATTLVASYRAKSEYEEREKTPVAHPMHSHENIKKRKKYLSIHNVFVNRIVCDSFI